MNESQSPKPHALVTKRHVSLAGLAAILGCAACCALPFLAAAGLGSGAAAGVGRILRPGSELVVGGVVFAATLAVMAIRRRLLLAARAYRDSGELPPGASDPDTFMGARAGSFLFAPDAPLEQAYQAQLEKAVRWTAQPEERA